VVGIRADGGEDHRNPALPVVPTCQHACGIVVDAAHGHVAREIHPAIESLFERDSMTGQARGGNTFPLKGLRQRDGLVPAEIRRVESLSVEIRCLSVVVVQERDRADPLANGGGRDVGDQPAGADAQNPCARERCLVEACNSLLPVLGTRYRFPDEPNGETEICETVDGVAVLWPGTGPIRRWADRSERGWLKTAPNTAQRCV